MHFKTLLKKLKQDDDVQDLRKWAFSVSNSTLYRLMKIYNDDHGRPIIWHDNGVFGVEIETSVSIFVTRINSSSVMDVNKYPK